MPVRTSTDATVFDADFYRRLSISRQNSIHSKEADFFLDASLYFLRNKIKNTFNQYKIFWFLLRIAKSLVIAIKMVMSNLDDAVF